MAEDGSGTGESGESGDSGDGDEGGGDEDPPDGMQTPPEGGFDGGGGRPGHWNAICDANVSENLRGISSSTQGWTAGDGTPDGTLITTDFAGQWPDSDGIGEVMAWPPWGHSPTAVDVAPNADFVVAGTAGEPEPMLAWIAGFTVNGTQKWFTTRPGYVPYQGCTGPYGRVLIQPEGNAIVVFPGFAEEFSPDGESVWNIELPLEVPRYDPIAVGSDGARFLAHGPEGGDDSKTIIKRFEPQAPAPTWTRSYPARPQAVFVTSDDEIALMMGDPGALTLAMLDPVSGEISSQIDWPYFDAPAAMWHDEILTLGHDPPRVRAADLDGTPTWTIHPAGFDDEPIVDMSVRAAHDGSLVVFGGRTSGEGYGWMDRYVWP
jgi:hypothetical protein